MVAQPDPAEEPSALSAWCEFHERVRDLPPDEREVVDLLFYQELTQGEDHRYVVKVEVFAAHDPLTLTDADLDEDHLEAVSQLLRA